MKLRIVGIGEVLWDVFPEGKQLGGAPANFAFHAQALGAESCIVSRIGQDADGREIIARIEQLGLRADCLQSDPHRPTGRVSVDVSPDGQPRFTIHENAAWDWIVADENARRAVAGADAVCFGSLAQRGETSRRSIQSLVPLARPDALRIFDVNLRQRFYTREVIAQSLALANVLKVNDAELPELSALFNIAGGPRDQLARLAERFALRAAACTRGAHGSLLVAGGRFSEHPGVATTVKDTVGAGDSFTAAMALGLMAEWDLDLINERANRIAAHVASCAGATPPLPDTLRAPFLDISRRAPKR